MSAVQSALAAAIVAGTAFAQGAESKPASTSGQTAPLDIVLLKDGAMFRGTISELLPNDHVVIVLVSGEAKRFVMATVKYAGPAARAPATSSPEPQATLKTVEPVRPSGPFPIQFLATRPDITFFWMTRSEVAIAGFTGTARGVFDSYHEICKAPCVETLRRGSYSLGLGIPEFEPVLVDNILSVDAPLTVRGHYDSRAGFRMAGWLLVAGSVLAGGVLSALSVVNCAPDDKQCSIPRVPLLVSGLSMGSVGTIVGLLMTGKDDEAVVDVEVWERK